MNSDHIIRAIREASAKERRPPGEAKFFKLTGLSRSDLWNAGYARYSEALAAAGLAKNSMTTAFDAESMLTKLLSLVVKLGRFPSKGDIKVERKADPQFPSYDAFFQLSGRSYPNLRAMLLDHCHVHKIALEIQAMLGQDQNATQASVVSKESTSDRVQGYVYLVKHGCDFKIGRSNDVTRRRREFALLLPQELEHIHVIETDDPEGIEFYWHRRFESRRSRGAWFKLKPQDVAAFRRRRYQ